MSYLAVIFDPLKEQPQNEFIGGLGAYNQRPLVYPFSVQIPEGGKLLTATTQTGKGGKIDDIYAVQKFESIFFRPSANLDVDATKWGFCKKEFGVQFRLKVGALEVVEPSEEALKLDPIGVGYHMYLVPDALKLVKCTNEPGLLKQWAEKEERKEVLVAIEKQFEAIQKHLAALKDG
jgi:hypothetical protein